MVFFLFRCLAIISKKDALSFERHSNHTETHAQPTFCVRANLFTVHLSIRANLYLSKHDQLDAKTRIKKKQKQCINHLCRAAP